MTIDAPILVIDDRRSLAWFVERVLHKDGFDVITAFDGIEAVRKVREENPDLILLDIVLPGLDGFQVLQLVRSFVSTPVIILTSEGQEDSVRRSLSLGADGYIVKPIANAELLVRVHEKLTPLATTTG